MRSGNVSQLDRALQAQQWQYIRKGTYLLLEKLKQSVARRLLKKIYLLKVEKGNQLHLGIYFLNIQSSMKTPYTYIIHMSKIPPFCTFC